VAEIATANDLDDPHWLLAGDELVIPARMPDDDAWEAEPAHEDPPYVDPATIGETLAEVAELYGWNPALVEAVAWQESRWTHNGVSWAGAIGVMQVLPQTAAEVGDWYLRREVDPWNSVWDNIEAGVAYLTILYDATDGDIGQTLAAYYQGLGSVERDGWFPDTEEYVNDILGYRDQFMAGELP
jgi:soluble lytic murein transglycosylase-like protein